MNKVVDRIAISALFSLVLFSLVVIGRSGFADSSDTQQLPASATTSNDEAELQKGRKKKYAFTYKDEKGIFRTILTDRKIRVNYSHGVPVLEDHQVHTIDQTEAPSRSRETKLIKNGNTYLIPAVIGNNGTQMEVRLLVDTGCSVTFLHYNDIKPLKLRLHQETRSVVADGRIVKGMRSEIDYLIVGPFIEKDFTIDTSTVSKGSIDYSGLLGMNFLRRHPFRIDPERNIIIWE